jgi:RNA polymerase sigma-70 factor, ECF subfamily
VPVSHSNSDENRVPRPALESTSWLLEQLRTGDESAGHRLVERYLNVLQLWARGRLPASARGMVETDDLVQVTLLRALKGMEGFEQRHDGAFFAYLRRILLNVLRDEIRRAQRRPGGEAIDENLPDAAPSLLEEIASKQVMDAYEDALALLPEKQQEAVILRVEMGMTHPQVAEALGMASASAARMAVSRALVRLAEVLDERSIRPE